MQLALSKDRPCYKASVVETPAPLTAIAASDVAVWALGMEGELYVRMGISDSHPLGEDWILIEPEGIDEPLTGTRVEARAHHCDKHYFQTWFWRTAAAGCWEAPDGCGWL